MVASQNNFLYIVDHVAFIQPDPLEALYGGRKEWEVRLSKSRSCIMDASSGDRCLIKRSLGEVESATTIEEVGIFRDLAPSDVDALRDAFGSGLPFEREYWAYHDTANYAIIIRFGEFVPAALPEKYTPSGVQLGWVSGFEHFEKANLEARKPLPL